MTTWLLHGFNVSDGGRQTVGKWAELFPQPVVLDYGWTGIIKLRWTNAEVVDELVGKVGPDDILVGHSNGGLICWQVAQRTPVRAVIVVNPALRRDSEWPDGLPVLCLYSSKDWVVQLGRWWARLASTWKRHGWGAAGRYGFTAGQPHVCNINMAHRFWPDPVESHSGAFKSLYWGVLASSWADTARLSHSDSVTP